MINIEIYGQKRDLLRNIYVYPFLILENIIKRKRKWIQILVITAGLPRPESIFRLGSRT